MRRAALLSAAALALAGCGSQGDAPCAVLQNGNQLCGNALVSWCELNNVGLDYPPGSPTLTACQAASRWSTQGQNVTTITPQSLGK